MNAYMIVDPTNVKPLFCRSFDSASDSAVFAGTSFGDLGRFTFGFPPTERHT